MLLAASETPIKASLGDPQGSITSRNEGRRVNTELALQVRGYGLSADAHHITQPAPDGRGATLAMQRALRNSGVSTDDVAYVNAHATSTPLGDAIEAAAIAKLFHLPTEGAADEILSGSAAAGGAEPSLLSQCTVTLCPNGGGACY